MQKTISLVVPVYNEEKNVPLIAGEIARVFSTLSYAYEIIFVNDGSRDNSQSAIDALVAGNPQHIKSIELSRNFGKESATSAGLHAAIGHAVMMIDADLQHPVDMIPEFITTWEAGTDVVIGQRKNSKKEGVIKHLGSKLYYIIMNRMSDTPLESGTTDFRLIDRQVVDEFNKLTEHNRITRGLIDWLGFKRVLVPFQANERAHGQASYSLPKLIRLALSSAITHSLFPLKFAGYLGIFITLITGIGGTVVFVERYVFNDSLGWSFTGSAQLAILIIFFIGIVLSCLGLIALYVGNIHAEVAGRPIYVVKKK
jgi:polyisoprenyl-phosphate glycosyltransferase